MITINDLNLLDEFWKWLCKLTDDYFYSEEGIREKKFNSLVFFGSSVIRYEYKKVIESIIYQAIDGYNNKYPQTITQDYYCRGVYIKGYENAFYYNEYKNKSTARLAALKWIWEKEK